MASVKALLFTGRRCFSYSSFPKNRKTLPITSIRLSDQSSNCLELLVGRRLSFFSIKTPPISFVFDVLLIFLVSPMPFTLAIVIPKIRPVIPSMSFHE
jgi:hypothetical protein